MYIYFKCHVSFQKKLPELPEHGKKTCTFHHSDENGDVVLLNSCVCVPAYIYFKHHVSFLKKSMSYLSMVKRHVRFIIVMKMAGMFYGGQDAIKSVKT